MNSPPYELAAPLLEMGRAGMELSLHPTERARLRYRPADLPPSLSLTIDVHRAAMLELLRDGFTPSDPDAEYTLGERLGVADDLGMPTHPGSAAWLVAVGESMGGAALARPPSPVPRAGLDSLVERTRAAFAGLGAVRVVSTVARFRDRPGGGVCDDFHAMREDPAW